MWRFRKKEKTYSTFPEFQYHAGQLSAYMAARNYFIIALKNGEVIHHHPKDLTAFHNWLIENKIRDINSGDV